MGGGGVRWLRGEVKVRKTSWGRGRDQRLLGKLGASRAPGESVRIRVLMSTLERPPGSAQSLVKKQRPMVDPLKIEDEQGDTVEGQGGH